MATQTQKTPLILFTTTTLLLLLLTAPTPSLSKRSTTTDLVTTTCNQTPDPKTCEAALRADPRSSAASNPEGLILIMIDSVKTRFTDALRVVQSLSKRTYDPDVTRALKDCIRVYGVVLDANVGVANNAVTKGDPKFGEQAMLDSGNEAEACWDGFPKGKVPVGLRSRTRELHGVCNVAASLIKTME